MNYSRPYSYDSQNGYYNGDQVPRHQEQFPTIMAPQLDRGYQQPQSSRHYYDQAAPGNPDVTPSDPYFDNMATMISAPHRYSGDDGIRYYQTSSGGPSSSPQISASAYSTEDAYYATRFTGQHRPRHSEIHSQSPEGQFIPTPSEMYSKHPISVPQHPPTQTPYSVPAYHQSPSVMPLSRSPEHRPARASVGRLQVSPTTLPGSSSTGERFPCERCGKTFSRSHDRKRHHETQHLASPVIHRCRYCEKEFSRADSLKRHLDNGCDEMP